MKHLIIGTAGHIDHGKTSLIKALTGRETDTLKEEKDRGISINLGFTYFELKDGTKAGIIDVPGHEKFIKNMLAGIYGIDIVLMIIAADEGIMPQTEEHLQILNLLGIKNGIIVLTKTDLIDDEWKFMVVEDIEDKVKGTFLENAPIVPVSSKTGVGIDKLKSLIEEVALNTKEKNLNEPFRMPIDRVFTISGFGTVITGTIISGLVHEGDIIQVYPSNKLCKVRSLQIHEKSEKIGEASQRCAINLSGIKKDEINRGDVVGAKDSLFPSLIVNAKIKALKSNDKPISNRQRVRIYHGTSEILARIILLNKEELNPGEDGFIQLRLEDFITCKHNDKFIIRNYSPMNTIGGGIILDPIARKEKRFNEEVIKTLDLKANGSDDELLENLIYSISASFPEKEEIAIKFGKNTNLIDEFLEKLVSDNKILKIQGDKTFYIHKKFYLNKKEDILNLLTQFHKDNPLKLGISKEELNSKIFDKKLKGRSYDFFIKRLENDGLLKVQEDLLSLNDFSINFKEEDKILEKEILNLFESGALDADGFKSLLINDNVKEKVKDIVNLLIYNGEIIKLTEDNLVTNTFFNECKDKIKDFILKNHSITPGETRELLCLNRKYSIALLQYLDTLKFTKRIEDKRVLFDG